LNRCGEVVVLKRDDMMRNFSVLFTLLMAICLVPVANAQEQRCFPETGQCISGPIRTYWERNGGLPVFGYPITVQTVEDVEGVPLQVQWFERDRLEIQPNGLVTAGRLGVERLEQLGTPWTHGEITGSVPGCLDFQETGYQVCLPAFAQYWRANGGLERFGFPVTSEFEATIEGKTYIVQYFERRRFELHPELGPNVVLLGLLGREVFDGRSAVPPPALPPPSFNNCQADPHGPNAPNYPINIVTVDKRAEAVHLQNVSGEAVNLDGWIMCSIRGNQQHDGIGGVIAPGETRVFYYTTGNIWNNSEKDDGALYNPQGQLVSYWNDGGR
jgi:hypothetical protein